MSRFSEPLTLRIFAHSPAGDRFPLQVATLEPRKTLEVDVAETLAGAGAPLLEGSLRVHFVGDDNMVQSWLLLEGPGGVTEIPLMLAGTAPAQEWALVTWPPGLQTLPAPEVFLAIHNLGESPVQVTLMRRDESEYLEIPPGGTEIVPASSASDSSRGWLRLSHDGSPAQIVASSMMLDEGRLARLPAFPLTPEKRQETSYSSLGIDPFASTRSSLVRRSFLSLFDHRIDGPSQAVEIKLLSLDTGKVFSSRTLHLKPSGYRELELPLNETGPAGDELRLQVDSELGSIHPFVLSFGDDGGLVEAELMGLGIAHSSGTYPLPKLSSHEVATTFLNLGSATTEIYSNIEWERGLYALPPIKVPPGAAYHLDFNDLAQNTPEDLLGRSLNPDFEQGFFQWTVRRGSRQILARTEVRDRGSRDTYGYNCTSCCPEFPWGGTEPSVAAFYPGITEPLTALEYIENCTGITLGPYYASPSQINYSSPLSWTGTLVSSQGVTSQVASFVGTGTYTWTNCSLQSRAFFGDVPIAVNSQCAEEKAPGLNPGLPCSVQTGTCVLCYYCCGRLLEMGKCICDQLPGSGSQKSWCKNFVQLTKCITCQGFCLSGQGCSPWPPCGTPQ